MLLWQLFLLGTPQAFQGSKHPQKWQKKIENRIHSLLAVSKDAPTTSTQRVKIEIISILMTTHTTHGFYGSYQLDSNSHSDRVHEE